MKEKSFKRMRVSREIEREFGGENKKERNGSGGNQKRAQNSYQAVNKVLTEPSDTYQTQPTMK